MAVSSVVAGARRERSAHRLKAAAVKDGRRVFVDIVDG